MSEKNFVAYGDAESILTGYANRIKQSPTTFVGTQAQWNALSSSQKAEYELVDITDDSLSPSGHVDWESFGELGAVNLFDFTINSTVAKGITFVQNSDGTVTVSGSNTQGSGVGILTKVQMLKKGTYILSGCPSITNGVLSLQLSDEPSSIGLIAEAKNGQEVTFTLASDTNVKIQYYANATASITGSVTIKPMLRLATDSDSTYQPYAMTNRALTLRVSNFEKKFNTQVSMTVQPNTTYFNTASSQSCAALKIGYLVVMNLVLSVKDNVTVPANTLACTITNVGAISANSSIFIGGNGGSNITRLMLRRNQSNSDNLDVYFIDSYSNSSMRASLVFMVNTIV